MEKRLIRDELGLWRQTNYIKGKGTVNIAFPSITNLYHQVRYIPILDEYESRSDVKFQIKGRNSDAEEWTIHDSEWNFKEYEYCFKVGDEVPFSVIVGEDKVEEIWRLSRPENQKWAFVSYYSNFDEVQDSKLLDCFDWEANETEFEDEKNKLNNFIQARMPGITINRRA